jgi:hypothetical protein
VGHCGLKVLYQDLAGRVPRDAKEAGDPAHESNTNYRLAPGKKLCLILIIVCMSHRLDGERDRLDASGDYVAFQTRGYPNHES